MNMNETIGIHKKRSIQKDLETEMLTKEKYEKKSKR